MMVQSTDTRGNPYTLVRELLSRQTENTPDFLERKMDDRIPVFVYGTVRMGGTNSSLLDDADWLGDGMTSIHKFQMMETPSGKYPVIFEVGPEELRSSKRGKIFGEVYMIDPLTLLALDQLEQNGVLYQRKKIWITLLDQEYHLQGGKKAHPLLECWVYIGKSFNPEHLIDVSPEIEGSNRVFDWNPKRDSSVSLFQSWAEKMNAIPF